jgi:hypothetical protein
VDGFVVSELQRCWSQSAKDEIGEGSPLPRRATVVPMRGQERGGQVMYYKAEQARSCRKSKRDEQVLRRASGKGVLVERAQVDQLSFPSIFTSSRARSTRALPQAARFTATELPAYIPQSGLHSSRVTPPSPLRALLQAISLASSSRLPLVRLVLLSPCNSR